MAKRTNAKKPSYYKLFKSQIAELEKENAQLRKANEALLKQVDTLKTKPTNDESHTIILRLTNDTLTGQLFRG
jgi:Septum formation initiator.